MKTQILIIPILFINAMSFEALAQSCQERYDKAQISDSHSSAVKGFAKNGLNARKQAVKDELPVQAESPGAVTTRSDDGSVVRFGFHSKKDKLSGADAASGPNDHAIAAAGGYTFESNVIREANSRNSNDSQENLNLFSQDVLAVLAKNEKFKVTESDSTVLLPFIKLAIQSEDARGSFCPGETGLWHAQKMAELIAQRLTVNSKLAQDVAGARSLAAHPASPAGRGFTDGPAPKAADVDPSLDPVYKPASM